MYYTRKILSNNEINRINYLIRLSNENNYWEDGQSSVVGYDKTIKNNLELCNTEFRSEINSIIMHRIDNDQKFINFTAAKTTGLNIISKFCVGSYFNTHVDGWSNGDYSTTVFLSDPKSYEGGELCLVSDYNGDEIKIKLPAGYGVTYPTGMLHRVNRVSSGIRYVSVFWTDSMIKDDFIRYVYSEISNLGEILTNSNLLSNLNFNKNEKEKPSFILNNLINQILRKYANK
jgi:PKHD-type hydroxylase